MKATVLAKLGREIIENPRITQRELAEKSGLSVGTVNKAIKEAVANHLINAGEDRGLYLSEQGLAHIEPYRVENAIILAAGFGSRCVPLTYETPKGLLKVNGKVMMERQIEQLLEKGIDEIIIVVGYMKEKFEYLIDRYGVKLVFNPEFSTKNNMASLYYALPYLGNSYILCADNWIEENIFNAYEAESWFSCPYFHGETAEWCVTATKGGRIRRIDIGGSDAYAIVGPAYFTRDFSKTFAAHTRAYYQTPGTEDYYWEHILRDKIDELPMYMNKQTGNVHEFENLEELRQYDSSYIDTTNNSIMESIAALYDVPQGAIGNIFPIKEGLTNKSFHFSVNGDNYVFRLPGTGTDKLINRQNEKKVYEAIGPFGLSDEVVSFDAVSGIKISRYYENARNADPFSDAELRLCMEKLRPVHQSGIRVEHAFDIEKMIAYYVSLAEGLGAIRFSDIGESKQKVEQLLELRRRLAVPEVLSHGDYAHVNVLMLPDGESKIIDWEFSGMADPIMDVSMYAIFAQFDRERIEASLRLYTGGEPTMKEYTRLYLYVALGGYLWCMWSQYKQALGQEFGEYPLIMYRYLKDYYNLMVEEGHMPAQ